MEAGKGMESTAGSDTGEVYTDMRIGGQIKVISSQSGTQLRNALRSVQRHYNLYLLRVTAVMNYIF